jgi:hypothetical protein
VHSRKTIQGCDGTVEIDEAARSVTKTYFHTDRETAVRNAHREVAYSARFGDVLAGVEGLACPRVRAHEASDPPRVVMDLCPGEELSAFLHRLDGRDPRIAQIARRMQLGLELYTRTFGEPYYDFCFNNMLFDERSGTLTLLDFVVPAGSEDAGPATPLEASLGWLVGCTCYKLLRPAYLLSSRRAHLALMQSVVAGFEGRVDAARVRARAGVALAMMGSGGGRLRRTYYRTIGKVAGGSFLRRLNDSRTLN